ncbi:hypothetical protein, partial [Actinoplanes teichomyceticus]
AAARAAVAPDVAEARGAAGARAAVASDVAEARGAAGARDALAPGVAETRGAADARADAPGLAGLRAIPARRARLDADELALIDQARRAGATWPAIAEALGLASRQAAEQRRHRLAQALARDARPQRARLDQGYGESLARLRESALDLHRRIGADRRWDGRFRRAALVRETLAAAPDAPPGALYDLVSQALADLTAAPETAGPADRTGPADPARPGGPARLPVPLRAAVERLRERWANANPD